MSQSHHRFACGENTARDKWFSVAILRMTREAVLRVTSYDTSCNQESSDSESLDNSLDEQEESESESEESSSGDLALRSLDQFARDVAGDNILIKHLLYYGDDRVHQHLVYQLAYYGRWRTIERYIRQPCHSVRSLHGDDLRISMIRGILDGSHSDLLSLLVDHRLVKNMLPKHIEQIHTLLKSIRAECRNAGTPKPLLIKSVSKDTTGCFQTESNCNRTMISCARHTSRMYQFTTEQIQTIIPMKSAMFWYDVLDLHSKVWSLRLPMKQVLSRARHLDDRGRGYNSELEQLVVNQFWDDIDRTHVLLEEIGYSLGLYRWQDILVKCCKRSMYQSAREMIRYMDLPPAIVASWLARSQNSKEFSETMSELGVDLSDHHCYLLRVSVKWQERVKQMMIEYSQHDSIRYCGNFALSRYQLSFGEISCATREDQIKEIIRSSDEKRRQRKKKHDFRELTIEDEDGEFFEFVECVDVEEPNEDGSNAWVDTMAQRYGEEEHPGTGDVIEVCARSWYVYLFTDTRKTRIRSLRTIPDDVDPEQYLPEEVRAMLDRISVVSQRKSARAIVQ